MTVGSKTEKRPRAGVVAIGTEASRKRAAARSKPTIGAILASTDFSPESLRALEYASLLLKIFHGSLHLVHVHEIDYAYAVPSIMTAPPVISVDEIERHYQTKLKKLAARYAPAKAHVKVGRAFDQICKLAAQIDARLIVISTHGRTGLKRIFLGSTAERVVQHARCPVLVVREPERDFAKLQRANDRKMKILVPVDFSECSRHALSYALTFAPPWNAEIILLHTINILPLIPPERYAAFDHTPSLGAIERAAKGQMRKLAGKTDFGGVPHRMDIQVGRPAEQICQYADDRGIDLIIASTHGHTGLAHVLIGSVAEHVVRYAHCPVLVVPHDKGPAH
ncbi:MAG TPA: universal stress protein [Chthoniobacterales bacterium]|nr:universal stress protein [Chthoniobacterales bacterium]